MGDYTDFPDAKKLKNVSRPNWTCAIPCLLPLLLAGHLAVAAEDAPDPLDPQKLEAEQVVIGNVVLEKQDVFDLSNPKENNALYRLANRLHIITRDSVIEKQLLFKPGDIYSKRLMEESERILRRNTYFYDVTITPNNLKQGTVDVHVSTRDVWTLRPGFSVSRSGGENNTSFKIEELNLFGFGQQLLLSRSSDVDRDSTLFEFQDKNIGRNRTGVKISLAENSDGHSNLLSVVRPFYALDTRWAAGVRLFDDERRSSLYQLGEKAAVYDHERRFLSAFGGWSAGLRGGWVRRFTAGIVSDDNQFSDAMDPTLPSALPDDRKLVYPFLGIEILEDHFETTRNRDQIERTEDFFMGTRFAATLGWSDESFGADRDAVLFSASAGRSYGSLTEAALLLSGKASGRIEDGDAANALLELTARYYRQQSEKRTFFATLATTIGSNLDLDNPVELGGDTGLRGYPLRYQSGDSKLLLTIEQRYFWDWYPFRLLRVGGAIFADTGRTWGDNPLGDQSLGWLSDVGFGLRFAPTRTGSRRMIHLDIAFPLNGDASIDSVQILLESKGSF
jgi:outer membrane protein assembly factor BamA